MHMLKGRVKDGRIELDEPQAPADLSEGMELTLLVEAVEPDDDEAIEDAMPAEERARLDAAIERGMADVDAGRGVDMSAFLETLESAR